MINRHDVLAARETIGGDLHRTPVFSSATLGSQVFLKAELFQRTGSFKPRGVLNKLRSLTDEERARGVIAASAGNHAQALAYCAGLEGLDALLVMWSTASQAKIEATRAYGAAVDLEVPTPDTVFERLSLLQEETGRTLVHPFDDPLVIAGQGTVGLEIAEDVPDVDVVLVPVGGGGLVAGIAAALPNTRVVGVEPSNSTALTAGLAAGEPTTVTARSIADGLNAPFAGELPIRSRRSAASSSSSSMTTRSRTRCGSSTSAPSSPASRPEPRRLRRCERGKSCSRGETVVAVVTGGNVSGETAAAILARP